MFGPNVKDLKSKVLSVMIGSIDELEEENSAELRNSRKSQVAKLLRKILHA